MRKVSLPEVLYCVAFGLWFGFAYELLAYGFDWPTFAQGAGGAIFAMLGVHFDRRRAR